MTSIISIKKNNKYVGISKGGEKGQIVIPKEVRDMFDINPSDSIVVLSDVKKGIVLVKANVLSDVVDKIFKGTNNDRD